MATGYVTRVKGSPGYYTNFRVTNHPDPNVMFYVGDRFIDDATQLEQVCTIGGLGSIATWTTLEGSAGGVLAIASGGTNATTASAALTNLGGLAVANNLSDVNNTATALSNLGGTPVLVPVAVVTAATFTAAASTIVPIDTTANACVVTLPTAPVNNTKITLKMVIQGGTNAVTIAAAGADVFNKTGGPTTRSLLLVSQALTVQYKTAGAIWYVTSDDLPLASIDLRYPQLVNNLSDLPSIPTALTSLNVPALYAGAYGVVANSTAAAAANVSILNDLARLVESWGGGKIILPHGSLSGATPNGAIVYIPGSGTAGAAGNAFVFRAGVQLEGSAGYIQGGHTMRATTGGQVWQYQRYLAGAVAYNAGTTYNVTYATPSGSFCTYLGNYWQSMSTGNIAHTPSATTGHQYWGLIGPVNQTTFNGVGTLVLNQTPQNIAVVDGTQFGAYGGVMFFQANNAGTTYTMLYTGKTGNTVNGCTISTGTATLVTGNELIFPQENANTAKINVGAHAGFPVAATPGMWEPVDNYSSSLGGDYNLNVYLGGATGDGRGNLGAGIAGANVGNVYNGQRTHVGCTQRNNSGSGVIANADSLTSADTSGTNGLGGYWVATGSHQGQGKSWNNGRLPLWKAQRNLTITTVAGSTAFTVTAGTPNMDDIGNNIYDATDAYLAGTNIAAGTFIYDWTDATHGTLSKAALASNSGVTAHVGGSFLWPTAVGTNNIINAVISPTDGFVYVMKAAFVTSNTDPNADTTNWDKIRLAVEWGRDVTESNAVGENKLTFDCQSAKLGAYNAINSIGSIVDLTGNGWISNPWSWNGALGAVIGNYTVPAALAPAGAISLGTSVGHNIRAALRQNYASSLGQLLQPGTATDCKVEITTDGKYGSVVGGTATTTPIVSASLVVVVDGAGWGQSAIDRETFISGPQGASSSFPCLAITNGYRRSTLPTTIAPASGALRVGLIRLTPGVPINSLSCVFTGAATAPTNWWMQLHTQAGLVLATTADQLTAVASLTAVTRLALTAQFTPTSDGPYYASIMQAATVCGTLVVESNPSTYLAAQLPISGGFPSSGLTTPGAVGTTPAGWAFVPATNVGFSPVIWAN